MLSFNGNYFAADQIDMIECTDKPDCTEQYPYVLSIKLRNGSRYSVVYSTKLDRNIAARNLARSVENDQRDSYNKILGELYDIRSVVGRLDKRQLRIWQQLKKLLSLQDEEGGPVE